ncbi:NAD-glutamate dehydrogenase domain-containing protein [Silvimonas sp.]|uniref:NAD-glutamate dehydrogenase domain-containing protein n=1 Tax=Silvimonas sp. TaxID=2650811 RepID=UPI00284A3381|nr:NAD-glutamate dehydrogenase domain-containing protein [Silvimonas sp.]MDR3426132.1 NAD-glutamate dehydrogenase [Silvimonas sp.]
MNSSVLQSTHSLKVTLVQRDAEQGIAIEQHPSIPALSALLPALHNMGLSVEREEQQERAGKFTHRSMLWLDEASSAQLGALNQSEKLADFLRRLFTAEAEDGRLNGLAVVAGLNAHEIMLIRAYASYLRQAGWHMSLRYMADCLRRQPFAVRAWLAYHHARLDPLLARDELQETTGKQLERVITALQDADAADLLEKLRQLVAATLRSNYFQHSTHDPLPSYLAFKLDAQSLDFLPKPRPFREIFVFSERFEGVHLRGGPVSRGGLRWSDRREDYRTEVLGLVKAQLVKNAVIVPTGAKGGFVCKLLPFDASRETVAEEGITCYRSFINALLDLTDNNIGGQISHPAHVVRHDAADPYLVVAADKGTASFSDTANAISIERGFWLGDAFASGGSNGYDHKKLGITAKGAWETAKIRFTEIGIDWTRDAFTAVGIGDMSGDVFGNGMLLMPHLRLIAAFDHRHIFIDPNPETSRAYAERERLFALPRSSWADYDQTLLSQGGGIWARTERSIPISPEIQQALGISDSKLSPEALIRAILAAPVTVLYNGGIGTYIKAASETHEQVRDRANDRIRLDAPEIRARMVVEGGNLGLTQAARIALAEQGVRVLTDAVDNSAGVDCSDHEVNLKILLQQAALAAPAVSSLLASMAPAVEQAVLATNRAQARRIMRHRHVPGLIADPAALLKQLENSVNLDRALEQLPGNSTLAAREQQRLVEPELAVVLAYAKMAVKGAFINQEISMQPWHQYYLTRYFPQQVRGLNLCQHALAREIIGTRLANEIVDRAGISFAHDLARQRQWPLAQVIEAFAFAYAALDLDSWLQQHDALITALPAATRHAIDEALEHSLADSVTALLSSPGALSASSWEVFHTELGEFTRADDATPEQLPAQLRQRARRFTRLSAATPLIGAGHSAAKVLGTLNLVSQHTGSTAVATRLDQAQDQHALTTMARIDLLIASRVLARGETEVEESIQALGLSPALLQISALTPQDEGAAVWREQLLAAVSALDEARFQRELGIYGR